MHRNKWQARQNRLLTWGGEDRHWATEGNKARPMVGLILLEACLIAILLWHTPPWRLPPPPR
jgi:hypothetical protein